jgi:NADH-quinone oxidoreductase subunit K
VSISYFSILSFIVFSIGVFSLIINRKNIIMNLIAFEIMILAAGINFISAAKFYNTSSGHVFVMFALSIAACEVAVGLSFLVLYFKTNGSIDINNINKLKDE